MLVSRLRKVLLDVISENQNAFVDGLQILDSVITAYECIDSPFRLLDLGVVCKLDFETAYDRVD